ncbi:DUF1501 domain-containing protein [uncultured Ferrimonas sp.]|uniref:DUF1501 domain-containing protein n=1 Tax=uncultured Ferrimonas sp. TaxID=432640 RepID=UPI00261D890B|nr:DUF1501 domain-containing protein [uncultured Ferrimonas sp.]
MTHSASRRRFLRRGAGAAVTATLGLGLPQLVQAASFAAQTTAASGDFKALIYLFLQGGNDSFNMVAPKAPGPLRDRYQSFRKKGAIAADKLVAINPSDAVTIVGGEQYDGFGMHPNCADLAAMFNQGDLGVVANMGNLVAPTSRQQYLDSAVELPPQLFSHADQQRQFQSSPSVQWQQGVGGALAQQLASFNQDQQVSPLISLAGRNTFQVSQDPTLSTFALSANGAFTLRGYYSDRKSLLDNLMQVNTDHLMAQKHLDTLQNAQQAKNIIEQAYAIADNNGVDYDQIFARHNAGSSDVGQQLKTVAKLIAGRDSTSNRRPVYFVSMGGFDTHQNLLPEHADLMAQLNGALAALREALVEQGDFDQALTFVGSEFGRTFIPNGDDDAAGTDHGWGGHALVMGGMVQGGKIYGSHPDLQVGQGLDSDKDKSRGRWIPTTATSQCHAVMANWMGVAQSDLTTLLPTLANFNDPFSTAANLGFIQGGAL